MSYIKKFDNAHAPLCVFNFEGNNLDSSENGFDLPADGTPTYRHILPHVRSRVGGALLRPLSDAALRVTGDITVNVLLVLRSAPTNAHVIGFLNTGDLEVANAQWLLRIDSLDTLRWQQERGAGINDDYVLTAPGLLPALGAHPHMLSVRRRNGRVSFAINGLQVGIEGPEAPPPTGGTTAVLQVGMASAPYELLAVEVLPFAMTDGQWAARYDETLGAQYGALSPPRVDAVWMGALTHESISIAAQLSAPFETTYANIYRVATSELAASVGPIATVGRVAKFAVTGLLPSEEYLCRIDGPSTPLDGESGLFTTAPTPGAYSFLCAFSGDAIGGSNHPVFDAIAALGPLFFWHLGDAHYSNIADGSVDRYRLAYAANMTPRQRALYGSVPVGYIPDDHDYGPNNMDGSYTGKAAAAQVYRERVPHYPLALSSGPLYHAFELGRVLFLVTDQRHEASPQAATDNASKTVLGATQKAWFKAQIAAATGKLIVWICSRTWGGVATAGADHWGGFTTERRELSDFIKANAHGRVVVLSADRHSLDIDDGSHHDFATGGGEPIKTFQASPLDYTPNTTYGGAGYSEGTFGSIGQFGTMEVTDAGGSSIDVTWRGFNAAGTELVAYSFTVNL